MPYTIAIDDFVLGVVHSDTDGVVKEVQGIDRSSIRSADIIPAPAAERRWPEAVGDVLHFTLCHEPTRTTH
jgi:hypothetical protein